jgi:hypothetical protein
VVIEQQDLETLMVGLTEKQAKCLSRSLQQSANAEEILNFQRP